MKKSDLRQIIKEELNLLIEGKIETLDNLVSIIYNEFKSKFGNKVKLINKLKIKQSDIDKKASTTYGGGMGSTKELGYIEIRVSNNKIYKFVISPQFMDYKHDAYYISLEYTGPEGKDYFDSDPSNMDNKKKISSKIQKWIEKTTKTEEPENDISTTDNKLSKKEPTNVNVFVIKDPSKRGEIKQIEAKSFEDAMKKATEIAKQAKTGKYKGGDIGFVYVPGNDYLGVTYFNEKYEDHLDVKQFGGNRSDFKKFHEIGSKVGTKGKPKIVKW